MTKVRKNGRPTTYLEWVEVPPRTAREVELFEETEFTKPVDFHSFRRAYKQALADAGVELQTAMALSGASSPKAHQRYLANTAKERALPAAALPNICIVRAENPEAQKTKPQLSSGFVGAGEEIRTLDVNLGKVALYH